MPSNPIPTGTRRPAITPVNTYSGCEDRTTSSPAGWQESHWAIEHD
jgi:hypothetical protein